jgi:adenylate cyclase
MKWFNPWTAIITLLLILTIRVYDSKFIESVRLRYFDTLITSKTATQNNIYTVNIDEKSLEQYGQWPFPRDVYGNIIKDLYKRKAGLVVLNVLMPEPDRNGKDAVLAEVMKNHPVVLSNVPAQQTKNEPKVPGSAVLGPEHLNTIVRYPGMIANIPLLENSAVGVGTTNTFPEIDGVNRRLPLIVFVDGKLYPNLVMETLRVATNNSTFQVKLNANGVEKMRLPGDIGIIDTDSLGRIWIDWSQKNQSVSLSNLPEDFKGSIVIVGVSAAGIVNPVATAIGPVWPQDLQAAVIGTMINKVNIKRPDWAEGAEVISLILLSLLLLILSRWVYVGIITGVVMIVVIVPLCNYLYIHNLWLLDATLIIAGLILVMLHAYGIKFISEYLQKQQIKKQFEHYLEPKMVKRLQENPELLKLGGETKELTFLFCDIRGFTPISEKYQSNPQGLTLVINKFLTPMTEIIMRNEGTIDKYMGDCIMAFWNAPLDCPNHREMAVKTALEMIDKLKELNDSGEFGDKLNIGIGINSGKAVVGNMGSNQRFDYSVLGDAVNLASRLEGVSKNYDATLVVGEDTYKDISNQFNFSKLDDVQVKGKSNMVSIYTVKDNNVNPTTSKKVTKDSKKTN